MRIKTQQKDAVRYQVNMKLHHRKIIRIFSIFGCLTLSACGDVPRITPDKMTHMKIDDDRYVEHKYPECLTQYCQFVMKLDQEMKERFK